MPGGWKSESDENVIRVRQENTVGGVSRAARRIYEKNAGRPGRKWGQGAMQEAIIEQKNMIRRTTNPFAEWISKLKW